MELITNLINSVKTTLDSINETIKKYQKSTSGWERISIADFRQYLSDRDLLINSYAEVSGKIWFGVEYDFSFIRVNDEKFIFYSTYDDDNRLTIEIHVTADHPIAKIKIKSKPWN